MLAVEGGEWLGGGYVAARQILGVYETVWWRSIAVGGHYCLFKRLIHGKGHGEESSYIGECALVTCTLLRCGASLVAIAQVALLSPSATHS